MTRLVLLGPPGCGKGVQAQQLQRRLGLPHIASGDLLRAHVRDHTDLGQRAQPFVARGDLVPDDLIVTMMAARLAQPDAQHGFVLDGFPRTLPQAQALHQHLHRIGQRLDAVIFLQVPEAELLRRLSGRLICPNCNAIYQLDTMPPAEPGICDQCRAPLIQRPDERPEVVRNRLRVYAELTQPLLAYYQRQGLLHNVNGTISVAATFAQINRIVEHLGLAPEHQP